MDADIEFARNMVKCLAGIEFQVIKSSKTAFTEYLQETLGGILLEFPSLSDQAAMFHLLRPERIYTLNSTIGLQYLLFLDNQKDRLFLLGPSLTESYSEIAARQALRQYALPQQTVNKLINQYTALPTVSSNVLHQLCILLMRRFTGCEQPISHHTVELRQLRQPQQVQQNEILRMRQVENRYELSSILTEAVKQGNLSMALELLGSYHPGVDNEARNANPLRNLQNYCIILNTQLRHALEESSIHPYQLDRLSSEIGLEIENLRSSDSTQDFVFRVIQRYCQLVQENAYPKLKPLIRLAVTYIKEHLNEDLTVKETAGILGVNANYLSAQFHESMGLTFIDFIHRERTNQAAALLKHTNLQIQQIASTVGYNNTSYFARQFARFQGKSPNHYRREGTL
ncbi:MAG: helix-turn-helix transcriptional regulator [Oscillospiraceae bacterium]|nr:helix-turn-helix transcriptional regulator [Oscillospiraceae bacterium]